MSSNTSPNVEHHKFNQDRQTNLLIEILEREKVALTSAIRLTIDALECEKYDKKALLSILKKAIK